MARWTVPGIRTTEIDNTIRTSAAPTLGVGAIVMKSNKGPVNQRIVTSSYDEFTNVFGEPENLDDYGHFAAENFLANGSQLYAVRATMGDEAYAQIQYPYTDAEADDKYTADDTAVFKFIDNEDTSNIELLQKLDTVVELDTIIKNDEWLIDNGELKNTFFAYQQGQFVTINDVISDAPAAVTVFKSVGSEGQDDNLENVTDASGKYIAFASAVSNDGNIIGFSDDLILTEDAWASSGTLPPAFFEYQGAVSYGDVSGFRFQFSIPKTDTLNGKPYGCTCYLTEDAKNAITAGEMTYSALFTDDSFYKGQYSVSGEGYCTSEDALKLSFTDWDDLTTKTYYVTTDSVKDRVGQAAAISFREYGMTNTDEALIIASKTGEGQKYALKVETIPEIIEGSEKISYQMLTDIVNSYGVELSEVSSDVYSIISYVEVQDGMDPDETVEEIDNLDTGKRKYKLIFTDSFNASRYQDNSKMYNENLFWMYSTKGSSKNILKSTYTVEEPTLAIIPWQEGMIKQDTVYPENKTPVERMGAFSTSEVLNSVDERYRDGYTVSIESDDEPGNGDIERYVSNKANQLIIAAIGPGKYGNDVGVSVITTACADIKALNHQNAFCWKYKYDDEDKVDDPNTNPSTLTWTKVYRINVYTKSKSQTADGAWGTGLDALVRDPVESWFVSNDPTAKDGEGNSLFAPNVINGKSEYIYVSRASVNDSMTGAGTYAMPMQTFSVYSLTGGENSKKNNMSEKTQALKLYSDRQKADFDILFNVDAIDTFNGRQRYAAHQQKIAEIAASRTMDVGMVQVTSKESKTIKRMLSEGKNFAFKNGTYVAPYANYDKYYNSTLASWIYLPKSVAGACAEAFCQVSGEPWMAPAGVAKGSIEYSTNQLKRLTDDEIGQLYINNINTSRLCGAYGEVLWGQKTALKKESALNRINVRCCLNYIEKQLEQMMNPFLFQQNTPNTRSSAKNVIDSFLDRVKAAGGILEYDTSVEEDPDDPHVMLVNIQIRPAESIEWIDIKITVTRSAINVAEG